MMLLRPDCILCSRSDGQGAVALGDLEADKELAELDVAMFSKAPAQAMEDTLAFLR